MSSQTKINILVNKKFGSSSTDVKLFLNDNEIFKSTGIYPGFNFKNLFENLANNKEVIHKLTQNWSNLNYENFGSEIKEPSADELQKNFNNAFEIKSQELNESTLQLKKLNSLIKDYSEHLKELQEKFESNNFSNLNVHEQNDIIESIQLLDKLILSVNKRINRINFK